MLEYVIVWWNVVRIIHATRYIRQVTSFSPLLLSYYHAPPAASSSSPALTPFLLSSFPFLVPTSFVSSPRVLPDLASFSRSRLLAASISYTPPHRHQHPPIRHPARTYIAARNAESYSVSLDSLKQVLMSCTPTPRSSPTAYPPSHRTLFEKPATFHATVTL